MDDAMLFLESSDQLFVCRRDADVDALELFPIRHVQTLAKPIPCVKAQTMGLTK